MQGLFTKILIGKQQIIRVVKVRLIFHRYAPVPLCIIELQDKQKKFFIGISEGETVKLTMGYRGGKYLEWEGDVSVVSVNENDQTQIYCRGIEDCFSQKITQTWINETPHAIVRNVTSLTGLPIGTITTVPVTFKHMIANDISIWEVVNRCENTLKNFGQDMSQWSLWVGENGINWGPHSEPGSVDFVSGDNLIKFTGDQLDLTAELTPQLKVSQQVNVKQKNIENSFRAIRVVHEISDVGRTLVQLERVNG